MSTSKTLYHFHSLTRVILVIGIIVVFNIFLSRVSLRLDLTENKTYTLSRSTKNILRGLNYPVTLKIFFSDSDELPEYLISVRRDVFDIISEYKRTGGKNIIIETYNPKKDADALREAESLGVPEIQFRKIGHKELEVKTGFSGMVILYQSQTIPIPYIQNINNLEYEITAGIVKMTQEKVPSIGIVKGHGEEFAQDVINELKKQYVVEDVYINTTDETLRRMDGLIVSGPTGSFTEKEKFFIDQFVMRGGKLFVLLNGVSVNRETLVTSVNDLSFNTLLESYGMRVNSDIVLDPASNEILVFQTNLYENLFFRYPPYPKVVGDGINRDNVITEKLQSLTFPFPSSLTIIDIAQRDDKKIIPLAKTTDASFAVDGVNAPLSPNVLETLNPGTKESKVLAVLITGRLESAFAGKAFPVDVGDAEKSQILTSTDAGSVFAAGTNRMFIEDNLRVAPENFVLLANALDVLVQNQTLVDIRSRTSANRPLREVSESEAAYITYANIFAGAFLAIVAGIVAIIVRKRKDRKAVERYA